MTRISAANPNPWGVAQGRPVALEVFLLQHTYVLPWNQFLYADGRADEIRIAFATHEVMINGAGLDTLLAALASQQVTRLQEPTRGDGFVQPAGQFIREISVVRVDDQRG